MLGHNFYRLAKVVVLWCGDGRSAAGHATLQYKLPPLCQPTRLHTAVTVDPRSGRVSAYDKSRAILSQILRSVKNFSLCSFIGISAPPQESVRMRRYSIYFAPHPSGMVLDRFEALAGYPDLHVAAPSCPSSRLETLVVPAPFFGCSKRFIASPPVGLPAPPVKLRKRGARQSAAIRQSRTVSTANTARHGRRIPNSAAIRSQAVLAASSVGAVEQGTTHHDRRAQQDRCEAGDAPRHPGPEVPHVHHDPEHAGAHERS